MIGPVTHQEIEEAIMKFGWLPYAIGEIVQAQTPYYKKMDYPCRIFEYAGMRRNGAWQIRISAGLIDKYGEEFKNHSINWQNKHDEALDILADKLEVLFNENGQYFKFRKPKPGVPRYATNPWNKSETLFAFCHWLMTKETPVVFSTETNPIPILELINEFLKIYELPKITEDFKNTFDIDNIDR